MSRRFRSLLFLLCPLLAGVVPAQAQAPGCDAAAAPQLDFWVGTWDLSWPPGQGGTPADRPGRGTNVVERRLGDCVIHEHFESDDGFVGESVSVYDPRSGTWRQTWVDNTGGYLLLSGAPAADGTMELRTEPAVNLQTRQTLVNRMVWRDVEADRLTWHWQRSADDGASWDDLWVITYARRR